MISARVIIINDIFVNEYECHEQVTKNEQEKKRKPGKTSCEANRMSKINNFLLFVTYKINCSLFTVDLFHILHCNIIQSNVKYSRFYFETFQIIYNKILLIINIFYIKRDIPIYKIFF